MWLLFIALPPLIADFRDWPAPPKGIAPPVFDGIQSTDRIDTTDGTRTWTTVGVGTNVIEASWEALYDAYRWGLTKHN